MPEDTPEAAPKPGPGIATLAARIAAADEEAKHADTLAGGILREAAHVVDGNRNAVHGNKEHSFEAIAALWNVYLDQRPEGPAHRLCAPDVAWMMVLLKIARSQHGLPVRDHFLDAAGYAAIAGQLSLPCHEQEPLRPPLGTKPPRDAAP